MPMNEEVRKAVRYGDECWDDGSDPDEQEMWQTIRAELTRLYAIADSVDPLVVRLGEVTAELERANALLREWLSGKWCTPEYNDARQRAYNHLSEPRT